MSRILDKFKHSFWKFTLTFTLFNLLRISYIHSPCNFSCIRNTHAAQNPNKAKSRKPENSPGSTEGEENLVRESRWQERGKTGSLGYYRTFRDWLCVVASEDRPGNF